MDTNNKDKKEKKEKKLTPYKAARLFYDKEYADNINADYIDQYKRALGIIVMNKESGNIVKLEKPLSYAEFVNCMAYAAKYNVDVFDILKEMENYKKLSTSSTTVNLTLQNWIRRDATRRGKI